jgi:hypothetical protein
MCDYFVNDITWCDNQKCKLKSCFRNQKNLKPATTRRLISIAHLEGTEYCPKEKENG